MTACGPAGEPDGLPQGETEVGDSSGGGGSSGSDEPEPEPGTTGDAGSSGGPGDDEGDSSGEPPPSDDDGSTGEPPPPSGLGCDRDDLLLCDDFEDGVVDEALWSIMESNGAQISIDQEFARHGGGSLRVSLPSADGARGGLLTRDGVVFPVEGNHFFGRAYFHVGPTVPQTHSSALDAHGDLDGAPARYRLDCNGGSFNSRYVHNPTVEQHGGLRRHGYDAPAQQWLCIEWEFDGAHDTMRYWMDGEEVESMSVVPTPGEQSWVAPIFEQLEIGWRTYQAAEPADVHWDALALATFRIGCE